MALYMSLSLFFSSLLYSRSFMFGTGLFLEHSLGIFPEMLMLLFLERFSKLL